jgi:sporulation protein YlmC with PRC-barrel domain
MKTRLTMKAIVASSALIFAPAAQTWARGDAQGATSAPHLESWSTQDLYSGKWSAQQMIGVDVRSRDGKEIGEVKDIIVGKSGGISKIVVEVGGVLEIGDQHIGVPWKDVQLGSDLRWISVPLEEVQNGTYSLYGRIPQGEDVSTAASQWRVNELVGDYASLTDVPRYGLVTDVIFDSEGKAQAVVVDRARGPWGGYGFYAYPYRDYNPTAYAYPLPYASGQIVDLSSFDYRRLAEQSEYANGDRIQLGGSERSSASSARGGEPGRSFASIDADNNGTLSRLEVAALPGMDTNFIDADRNGDMRLSPNEYQRLRTVSREGENSVSAEKGR